MNTTYRVTRCRLGLFAALALPLAGCVGAPGADDALDALAAKDFGPAQECLARAMYFESNRSSEDGMLAVGTVVMNRVDSPDYPNEVCDVVGQPNQFASGVMTREMGAGKELAMKTAQRVLSGERLKGVAKAKYFHTAGLNFGYGNMSYRLIAGGNAFYEKISRRRNPDVRIVSQAEVRQSAAGAIQTMRTAAYSPSRPSDATTAIGYAEPEAKAASAAAVPNERPAAGEAATEKSPFLAMVKDQKPVPSPRPGRGGRVAEAAPQTADTAAASDLPGVGSGESLVDAAPSGGAAQDDAAWLARW